MATARRLSEALEVGREAISGFRAALNLVQSWSQHERQMRARGLNSWDVMTDLDDIWEDWASAWGRVFASSTVSENPTPTGYKPAVVLDPANADFGGITLEEDAGDRVIAFSLPASGDGAWSAGDFGNFFNGTETITLSGTASDDGTYTIDDAHTAGDFVNGVDTTNFKVNVGAGSWVATAPAAEAAAKVWHATRA